MGQKRRTFSTVAALCALSISVRAEPATPSLTQPAPLAAPAQPAPAAAAASSGEDGLPQMPDIKDPMLEPIPPAANTLMSWRDALRFVRQRSTAMHIAQATVTEAQATTTRARSASLPNLGVNGNLTHYLLKGQGFFFTTTGAETGSIPDPATRLTGSLDLRQPLINFGAWYSVGTAKSREQSAELSASDTQRQLLGAVAQAAVGVTTASRVAESSRVSLASDLSTLDLTRRRAALGAASAVDVLRAEQEVALTRAQLVTADESLREARETLGASLGDTAGWGVSPEIRVEDLEHTASSVCTVIPSLDARADIQSAHESVTAAERDKKGVDYQFLPTLDFTSSLSYVNSTVFSPNGNHVNWTIGGQLGWTLYDGGDRYGQRRFNEAATTIAREQFTQKKRDATLQLVQADRAIAVAKTNLEVSKASRDLAKEAARLSRLAFVNGSGTSFDLVDNAKKLREAEIDLLIKDFQLFQATLTAFLARTNCSI
jgi:outer membrane protein TolC